MFKTQPVSFLIPAHNAQAFLPDAVNSILFGNMANGDEIIIVDDASTDETVSVANKLAARHSFITVIRHRHNKGSAGAGRNTAIEHAKNDLFFALDADNLLAPHSLPKLNEYMANQNAAVAAFQEVRFFSNSSEMVTHSWFYRDEISLSDALAGHQWPGPDGNYLFTRESWLRAGRYDEFVGCGIDSWAFGIRQLASGAKMVSLPHSHYFHRWGHDSAWMRDAREGNQSLKAIRVILPLLGLLEQDSVEYIFSAEGRLKWFIEMPNCPLRLRGLDGGSTGDVVWNEHVRQSFLYRLKRFLARKIALQ